MGVEGWICLSILSLVYCLHGLCATKRSYTYTYDGYNRICDYDSSLKNNHITSAIHCMSICTNDISCRSVIFNKATGVCSRCLAFATFSSEIGSRSFRKVDNDCEMSNTLGDHIVSARRVISKTGENICFKDLLTVFNGADDGKWHDPEFCNEGSYAVGYALKIEAKSSGLFTEESGLNALRLMCGLPGGRTSPVSQYITSTIGHKGSWGEEVSCSENTSGYILKAFQLQVETQEEIGAFLDQTAANYVAFLCGSLTTGVNSTSGQLKAPPGYGPFGTFGEWSKSCEFGQGICGLRVKLDESAFPDFSGIHDVVFYCCY